MGKVRGKRGKRDKHGKLKRGEVDVDFDLQAHHAQRKGGVNLVTVIFNICTTNPETFVRLLVLYGIWLQCGLDPAVLESIASGKWPVLCVCVLCVCECARARACVYVCVTSGIHLSLAKRSNELTPVPYFYSILLR